MVEAAILSEKLRRYGVLGAGIVTLDSSITLRLAHALDAQIEQRPCEYMQLGSERVSLAHGLNGSVEPSLGSSLAGKTPTRLNIIDILKETTRVTAIVQKRICQAARELGASKNGKKKKKTFAFVDAHKKILEMGLPREPLEEMGMHESVFQELLSQYEEDKEVMEHAKCLFHPVGKGDPEKARSIRIDKLIEIHQFMVQEMRRVLQEFRQLPEETRHSVTGKSCENTAELLVSLAVEQQLGFHCDEVEQAVIYYEEALGANPEFSQATDELAQMMQFLIGASQPRRSKSDFLAALKHMGAYAVKARAFSKKIYEDYRSKSCSIVEAYSRFEAFNVETTPSPSEVPEFTNIEMQLCYEEYCGDKEIKEAWDLSGAETGVFVQSMANTSLRPTSAPIEEKKGKRIKPSDVTEMQQLMVDELKRLSDAVKSNSLVSRNWKPELVVQMIQALASGAVEKRFGVSAEEMTKLGFQHAATLQRSERFVLSTQKQQEILMEIPQFCKP